MLTERDRKIADRLAATVMWSGVLLVIVSIISATALMAYGVLRVIG